MTRDERGVRPALEAEEWAEVLESRYHLDTVLEAYGQHACAALCLHGQPFGFRERYVRALRELTWLWLEHPTESVMLERFQQLMREHFGDYTEIADRLEALLPPVGLQGEGDR